MHWGRCSLDKCELWPRVFHWCFLSLILLSTTLERTNGLGDALVFLAAHFNVLGSPFNTNLRFSHSAS